MKNLTTLDPRAAAQGHPPAVAATATLDQAQRRNAATRATLDAARAAERAARALVDANVHRDGPGPDPVKRLEALAALPTLAAEAARAEARHIEAHTAMRQAREEQRAAFRAALEAPRRAAVRALDAALAAAVTANAELADIEATWTELTGEPAEVVSWPELMASSDSRIAAWRSAVSEDLR